MPPDNIYRLLYNKEHLLHAYLPERSDIVYRLLCVLDNTTKVLYPKLAVLTIDIS